MTTAANDDDEAMILEAVRDLVREKVAPRAADIDATGEFSQTEMRIGVGRGERDGPGGGAASPPGSPTLVAATPTPWSATGADPPRTPDGGDTVSTPPGGRADAPSCVAASPAGGPTLADATPAP